MMRGLSEGTNNYHNLSLALEGLPEGLSTSTAFKIRVRAHVKEPPTGFVGDHIEFFGAILQMRDDRIENGCKLPDCRRAMQHNRLNIDGGLRCQIALCQGCERIGEARLSLATKSSPAAANWAKGLTMVHRVNSHVRPQPNPQPIPINKRLLPNFVPLNENAVHAMSKKIMPAANPDKKSFLLQRDNIETPCAIPVILERKDFLNMLFLATH